MQSFKTKYLNWKMEGKTDQEICDILEISRSTLLLRKKMYKIPLIINRKNTFNIPEMQMRIGMMNGLSRRLILRRVRDYGWSIQDAIHIPNQKNRKKGIK